MASGPSLYGAQLQSNLLSGVRLAESRAFKAFSEGHDSATGF